LSETFRRLCRVTPKDVVKKINWNTLKLKRIDTRSIDEKNKKTIADILFLAWDKKERPLYLLLHIEHFSSLPKEAILRTVQYQVSALLDYMKLNPNKLLPSPVSIIYYHGRHNVKNKPTQMSDLFESKDFLSYFANPIFHDISHMTDEELNTHGSMSGIDLLYKNVYKNKSAEQLDEIFPKLSAEPRQLQQYIVRYVLECWDLDPDLIKTIATKHFDKRAVMTAAKQIEKQIIRESAKRLLKLGASNEMVMNGLKISKREIEAIKKELKKTKEVA
jgi:hypothetical protein